MKEFVCCLLLISVVLFSGCSMYNGAPVNNNTHTQAFPPEALPESTVDTEPTAQAIDDVWDKYVSVYNTHYMFADLNIKGKCLLIGEENIVQVMSISGYDAAVVIRREFVERVEHKTLTEFSKIEIYDKTNQCISIMTTPEEAAVIVGILN